MDSNRENETGLFYAGLANATDMFSEGWKPQNSRGYLPFDITTKERVFKL